MGSLKSNLQKKRSIMLRARSLVNSRALTVTPHKHNAALAGDPERLRQMIDRKKALLKKASSTPPKKLPITDYYIPYTYKKQAENSPRTKSQMLENEFNSNEESVLQKNWSHYQLRLVTDQRARMKQPRKDQEAALEELRQISPYLYNEAVKPMHGLELNFKGAAQFPPKKDYHDKHVPMGTTRITAEKF